MLIQHTFLHNAARGKWYKILHTSDCMIVSQNVTFQRNFLYQQTYGKHDKVLAHFGTHSCDRHRFHGVFVYQISHLSFCLCYAHNISLKNWVSQAITVCRETIQYIQYTSRTYGLGGILLQNTSQWGKFRTETSDLKCRPQQKIATFKNRCEIVHRIYILRSSMVNIWTMIDKKCPAVCHRNVSNSAFKGISTVLLAFVKIFLHSAPISNRSSICCQEYMELCPLSGNVVSLSMKEAIIFLLRKKRF